MTKRQALALRGAAASAVATLVAALSHSWAGGDLPDPLIVVGMAALLVLPGMALMGSRPRAGRIAVTVPVLQGVFHAVFSLLGSPTGVTVVVGHPHHDMPLIEPTPASSGGETAGWSPFADTGMLVAHVIAAVVTFWLLAYGERVTLAVLAWATEWVRSRAELPVAPVSRRGSGIPPFRVPVVSVASSVVRSRGPPALCC